ncbi:sigma-54-dependent Fis family transcriptional regulator [Geomonas limicola]|uniref:Sigma-54-dependent Fis family transcriptional regulator n=1 Tax=Geomonas limicola TaxID=2740186 RepID=A0A6V8NFC9_9BACT|nr:sigma-54 dependent transcriptional regulator [Geomonas limicola]GFO70497.1 sigma-54-dependent Fis family transcriptional regulator [Geomonas limicola]
MKQKILLIEDDTSNRLGIVRSLSELGFAVSVSSNLANAEEDVLARRFDAVVLGVSRACGKASGFIRAVRVYDPYLPIVVLTGSEEIEVAVDAVRCGADNVLGKPVDLEALSDALKALLADEARRVPRGAGKVPARRVEERFFGTGPAARRCLELATQAAAGSSPVLITGETGTGKGLLAKWIHQKSFRATRPFAALNCSGLPGKLVRAELFGTRSGGQVKPGLLEQAAGGTLFLDEIGDLDLAVQGELLAALTARPGVPFRLICSTNHQLDALACAGYFLPDLLYFVSGSVLRIPPLRERLRELPNIVRFLLDELRGPQASISDEALATLKGYHWPGNLRELKNALEQGLIVSQGAPLGPEHFNWLKPSLKARGSHQMLTMSEVKEQHIAAVLKRTSGDMNAVAHCLGISRATMYRKLKQLGNRSF